MLTIGEEREHCKDPEEISGVDLALYFVYLAILVVLEGFAIFFA